MSPILKAAVAKARRSLNAPKNKRQAERRLARYNQVARSKGDIDLSRMAHNEAWRLEQFLQTGKYGRGDTEGRAAGEAVRAKRRQAAPSPPTPSKPARRPKGAPSTFRVDPPNDAGSDANLKAFAERVKQLAAATVTPPFSHKAAISQLYDAYGRNFSDAGRMDAFKARLLAAHNASFIDLLPLDDPKAMDPAKRARSEIKTETKNWHFVDRRAGEQPATRPDVGIGHNGGPPLDDGFRFSAKRDVRDGKNVYKPVWEPMSGAGQKVWNLEEFPTRAAAVTRAKELAGNHRAQTDSLDRVTRRARRAPVSKASLYTSTVKELRAEALRRGLRMPKTATKREIVDALKREPSFRDERSRTARQLREARGLMRDLNMEAVSHNMVGALRGALSEAARVAPDAGTKRQMRGAESKVGAHLFADLDAHRAKREVTLGGQVRDRRLLPKDSHARPLMVPPTADQRRAEAMAEKLRRYRARMGEKTRAR